MADDGNTILVYYPPDSKCFMDAYANASHGYDEDTIKDFNCTVSQTMVTYLNLTEKITDYVAAYCTNPPKDDNCPFDFCPNPDIAGMILLIPLFSIPVSNCIFPTQARWCGSQVSSRWISLFQHPNLPVK